MRPPVKRSEVQTAHLLIVQELARRGLPHTPVDDVDAATATACRALGLTDAELEELQLVDKAMTIQTLIFDKGVFKTREAVSKWVKDHGFSVLGKGEKEPVTKPGIDETGDSFRVRQRDPGDFVPGSFRTIRITDGVKAVVGQLKPGKAAKADGESDDELLQPVLEALLLPVDKADEDKQIVLGVVLEPDTVDTQGDTISPDEIERAAHLWLARFQDRGFMHRQIVNSKIEIYESYLAPKDLTLGGQKVKKGTWLLMYHVTDDTLWAAIKRGELTGFSMGGFARRVKPT